MIIDPWGTVIAQAPDQVGIIRAELDLDRVAAVRRQIPVLANRRPAAYPGLRLIDQRDRVETVEEASARRIAHRAHAID